MYMAILLGSPSQPFRALLAFILLVPVEALTNDIIFSSGFEQSSNPIVAHPLNDTGITYSMADETCIDVSQDCSYGRDATHNDDSDGHAGFSFTKLDMSGNALSASATSWACVRDNVTGHIWEVKTGNGGLRDFGNTYTWYNPDPETNGGDPGTADGGSCTGSDCDTASYVEAVNTLPVALCGYRDWRIPWKEELLSIADYGRAFPAVDTDYFPWEPEQPGPHVWTDSAVAYYGGGIYWDVRMQTGEDFSHADYISNRVRLVRHSSGFSLVAQREIP